MAVAKKVPEGPRTPEAFRKKMADAGWTEQGGEIFKWEEGIELEGFYRGMIPARDKDSSPVLKLQTENVIERWYAPTILASRFETIEVGTLVLIVCLGQVIPVKNRKEKAWGFEVYTKGGS